MSAVAVWGLRGKRIGSVVLGDDGLWRPVVRDMPDPPTFPSAYEASRWVRERYTSRTGRAAR